MKHRVREFELAGGARGLVIDVPGTAVVSLQLRFNSGFQFANAQRYEVPHVMEHLLATVTKNHPGPNEFHIEATKNGAYLNASTSTDVNAYIYECADFELDRILDLAQEQLTAPLFDQKPLEAEIGNVKEELSRNTTQHGSVCAVQLGERAFPKLWQGYEQRIAHLPQIQTEHVRSHYEQTHTAANARFVVAGHFPDGGEKVAKRLDACYAKLKVGERLERNRQLGLGLSTPVTTPRDIAQLYYRVVLYFGELDSAEWRVLMILHMVLVGGFASRVLGQARQRGLAYHVSGAGQAEPGNSSFGFGGFVTPEHATELFDLMTREFNEVAAGKLSAQEVRAAQDLMIGQIKRSTQTPGDLLSWYMDRYDQAGEIRGFDTTLEQMRAVKPEDVTAVAAKAAATGRQGISFVGQVDDRRAADYAEILAGMKAV